MVRFRSGYAHLPIRRVKVFRINVLGGFSLERDGTRVEDLGPRRTGLLAALAVAGPRGVSRDRLLLYLWPDSTEVKARHSLAQSVYSLHRTLGVDVVDSAGHVLRLLDGVVTADVGDFLVAHSQGDVAAMAALYTGPLLDGFILSNAADFDSWAAGERARLERLAIEAIERAAVVADETGDPVAEQLWRRLTLIDPLVTRFAIGLARALAGSTDPAAAVRHLREHARRLRTEFGVAAPAELDRAIAELTRQAPPPAATPGPTSIAERGSTMVAEPEAAAAVRAPVASRPRRAPRMVVGLIVVGLVAIGLVWNGRRPVRSLTGGAMVVLADVENLTRDSTLGRALRVAIEVGLHESSSFSVYPRAHFPASLARMGRTIRDTIFTEPLAREVAVRETGQAVVVFSVSEIGGRYIVASRIVDPTSGRALAANQAAAAQADALLDVTGRMVVWTRRRLGDNRWQSAQRLPLVTTNSLAALSAFAEGGVALARSDWTLATTMLRRAMELDTGFAMAKAVLGEVHLFNNRVPEGLALLRDAARRLDRLSEPEELNLKVMLAQAEGRTAARIDHAAVLAMKYPSTANWQAYAEALRAAGRYGESVVAFQRALQIDSTDVAAIHGLALAEAQTGNYRDAIDAYARVDRLDSTWLVRDFFNHQWGTNFVRIGDYASAEAAFGRMLSRPTPRDQARGHRSLAYLAIYRGRFAEATGHLRAGIPLQVPYPLSEYRDLVVLAGAERSRGDPRAAGAALDRLVEIFQSSGIQAAAVMFGGHQLVRAGRLGEARLFLDSLAARAALRPNAEQDQAALAILRADLAMAQGRYDDARAALMRSRFDAYNALGFMLRAEAFAAAGQLDSALVLAKLATEDRPFGLETQLDWHDSFAVLARVAERAGDAVTAREAWSALIEQWKDGDAGLPALVTARQELARLQGRQQ